MFRQFFCINRRCALFAIILFFSFDPFKFAAAQSTKRSGGQTSSQSAKRLGVLASSADEMEVRSAYLRSLAAEKVKFDDFKTIFNWLTKTSGKEKWRQVRWRHDLWDARIESAKTGKPIFIWAMNGDPLGCV